MASRLKVLVSKYFASGLACSTQNTYSSAKKKYLMFCQQYELTPIPMSEYVSCLFVDYLTKLGMSPSLISTYLAAMHHLQVETGHPLPQRMDWLRLQYTLKGIKRSRLTSSKRSRLPIISDIMKVILSLFYKL